MVGGAATLGAEVAAARLLAPVVGASTVVWATTIAIVLLALAVGHEVGGRLADREPHVRGLARWMLAGAALVGLLPLLATPVVEGLAPLIGDRPLLGTLLGASVVVGVPALVLGVTGPWALRLAVQDGAPAGRAAGRLAALATGGSLVGTFAATLVLLPLVGTQRTFLVLAAVLALSAVGTCGWARRGWAVPAGLVLLLVLPPL